MGRSRDKVAAIRDAPEPHRRRAEVRWSRAHTTLAFIMLFCEGFWNGIEKMLTLRDEAGCNRDAREHPGEGTRLHPHDQGEQGQDGQEYH